MKIIGLIGGMSWRSTVDYYAIINDYVNKNLGKFHSAKIVMFSVDFEEIEQLQYQGKWAEATDIMIDAAKRVERAGADFVLICTNTMHKMADEIRTNIGIPLLHIADATAKEIKKRGFKKVGLLGTRFTMEQDFYRENIARHKLEVIIPDRRDRETIHQIIYGELISGKMRVSSRQKCRKIIDELVVRGSEGIILGCTELPLLIKQEDSSVPLFDTTRIHAIAAGKLALGVVKKL